MATRLTSICVAGLQSTSKWVDHFSIELYSDSGYTDRLSTQTASAIWDGTYSTQQSPVFFSGLTFGQQYYLRAGVVSPATNEVVWTDATIVAGGGTAPSVTYSVVKDITPSGAHLIITPGLIPSDIDHYEATWNYDGQTPAASDIPKWSGDLTVPQNYFEVNVGTPKGTNFYLWVRACNTAHQRQPWQALGNITSAQVDPTHSSFLSLGSVPPALTTVMTYVSTASSIAWYWDGEFGSQVTRIYRADGTITTVPASRVGTAGLASSTAYYFYPYYKEVTAGGPGVGFAAGGVGVNDGTVNSKGGAGIAQTSRSLIAASAMGLQGHIGLSPGGMAAQTVASGTSSGGGGGSGGGSGGGGGCPRRGMVVMTRERGIQPVEALVLGDELLTRDGEWTTVTRIFPVLEGTFIRLVVSNTETIDQSPETPMPLARGEKLTKNLSLNDILIIRDDETQRFGQLRRIEVVDEVDYKYAITCSPTPEFFCGSKKPTILTHNMIMTK